WTGLPLGVEDGGESMTQDGVVYVVDDDESVRRSLVRLLRSVGHEAVAFPSATAFLEREIVDRPSCLILDLRLRGPSGLDLQAELGDKEQSIPIIFITGHGYAPASCCAMSV